MAKGLKKCRVCGKEYSACVPLYHTGGFRWQAVSCSPECGSIYLKRVLASRTQTDEAKTPVANRQEEIYTPPFDEYDVLFEEEIDDLDEGMFDE